VQSRTRQRNIAFVTGFILLLAGGIISGIVSYIIWTVISGPADVEYYLKPYPTLLLANENYFTQGVEIQNLGDQAALVNTFLQVNNGVCEFANVRIDQNTPWMGFSFNVHVSLQICPILQSAFKFKKPDLCLILEIRSDNSI